MVSALKAEQLGPGNGPKNLVALEYTIPAKTARSLQVGHWVEILQAEWQQQDRDSIRVIAMRVAGTLYRHQRKNPAGNGVMSLRPHEGWVASLVCGPSQARFTIQLS